MTNYTTTNEAIQPIKERMDYTLNPQERAELITYLLDEDKNTYDNLVEYLSSKFYRKIIHGYKKKSDFRSDENFFCKQLDSVSDYLLHDFDIRLDVPEVTRDYKVLSRYALDKGVSDGQNRRVVGLYTAMIEAGDKIPPTVAKGLEVYVEAIDEITEPEVIANYKLSEDKKRENRKAEVNKYLNSENVDPNFVKMYREWEDLGIKYGLHESYSKDEKREIKSFWIGKFVKDKDHPLSPKDRFMKINKQYNQFGYDLHLIVEKLRQPVAPRKVNQRPHPKQKEIIDNYHFFKKIDLTDSSHVNALLSVVNTDMQKTFEGEHYKWKEYHPIYKSVAEKHKDKHTYLEILDSEFKDALEVTDLDDIQRDIVNLILDQHEEISVYDDVKINPYKLIAEYINEKYDLHKSKTEIKHIIEQKIAKIIANTYQDLENGLDIKECNNCGKEKMASKKNFSPDSRNKSGLKGTCKKCLAEKVQNAKKVS
jgi:rubrerythrin